MVGGELMYDLEDLSSTLTVAVPAAAELQSGRWSDETNEHQPTPFQTFRRGYDPKIRVSHRHIDRFESRADETDQLSLVGHVAMAIMRHHFIRMDGARHTLTYRPPQLSVRCTLDLLDHSVHADTEIGLVKLTGEHSRVSVDAIFDRLNGQKESLDEESFGSFTFKSGCEYRVGEVVFGPKEFTIVDWPTEVLFEERIGESEDERTYWDTFPMLLVARTRGAGGARRYRLLHAFTWMIYAQWRREQSGGELGQASGRVLAGGTIFERHKYGVIVTDPVPTISNIAPPIEHDSLDQCVSETTDPLGEPSLREHFHFSKEERDRFKLLSLYSD